MKQTLLQHFSELKKRILWVVLFFVLAFAVGFYLSPFLQSIIAAPLFSVWDSPVMIYTGISDGLTVQFSMAGFFAIFISAPVILFQVWMYISPALKKNEKKIAVPILIMSPLLFLLGAIFAYFVLLPIMFRFFIETASETAVMMPNVKNYIAFSIELLKAFGLAFQFPLVLVLLNKANVVSKKQVMSIGRYIVVGVFVLAAVLTPPDIVSQIALAVPMILLFGLALLFMV